MNNMLLRRRIMLGLASSPFSPEATAILKEDFPDEWNDIKAYGYNNPQMVPYVNEDPYFVVSLGLVSNVYRFLVGDGIAYLETNFVRDLNDAIKIDWKFKRNDINISPFSERTAQNDSSAIFIQYRYQTSNFRVSQGSINGGEQYVDVNITALPNTLYKQIITKDTFTSNGTTITTGISATGTPTAPVLLFKVGNTSFVSESQISKVECENKCYLVPCKNPNGNDYGMLDIINDVFYPNSNNSGTFTIEYSGRPYLNITSTTKTYIINTYGENAWNTVKEFFTDPATESLVAAVNSDPTIVEELCGINLGELRSLKSNKKAYITTNYVVGQYDFIETEFYCAATTVEQAQYVFGAMDSGFGENGTCLSQGANGLIRGFFGGNRLGGTGYSYDIGDIDKHLFKYIGNKDVIQLYKDGILAVETAIESSTFTSNSLIIFSHNRTGQDTAAFAFTTGSIKYLRIKKNGVYSMYLIPRTVNNNVGFLDVVSNTMLYNSSYTGSLSIITEQ